MSDADLMREVGTKSSGEDLAGIDFNIFCTSSGVTGEKELKGSVLCFGIRVLADAVCEMSLLAISINSSL